MNTKTENNTPLDARPTTTQRQITPSQTGFPKAITLSHQAAHERPVPIIHAINCFNQA